VTDGYACAADYKGFVIDAVCDGSSYVPAAYRRLAGPIRLARLPPGPSQAFRFAVLFTFFEAWLLVPAIAVGLSAVLSRAGHVAVSNRDVVDFLLTPPGLLYAALLSTAGVALLFLEQAGIMALTTRTVPTGRRPLGQTLSSAFGVVLRLGQLAGIAVALLALTFVPFVVPAVLAVRWCVRRSLDDLARWNVLVRGIARSR
jgi:hypothetical protein